MTAIDKAVSSDITLGQLLDGLAAAPEAPLAFLYEGQPVKAGYHVTEVKAGAFSALDCGANPEAWSEMFIQLWDIDEDGRDRGTQKDCRPEGSFSAPPAPATQGMETHTACPYGPLQSTPAHFDRKEA